MSEFDYFQHKHYPPLTAEMLLGMLPINRKELIDKYGSTHTDDAVKELRKTHKILSVGWTRKLNKTIVYELDKS
jgi:hypothetical protein